MQQEEPKYQLEFQAGEGRDLVLALKGRLDAASLEQVVARTREALEAKRPPPPDC